MPPSARSVRRFSLAVPTDFILARDYCSYGYFLLAPNHWEPETYSLIRVLELENGAVSLRVHQLSTNPGAGRARSNASSNSHDRATEAARRVHPGSPLGVVADRTLTSAEVATAKRLLSRMLRLDEDHGLIKGFHKVDPRWQQRSASRNFSASSKSGPGRGRLMRSPTFFEDVIKTVTSCNVTWPSTVTMNRRLCEVFGERSVSGGFAFPGPERLARVRPAALRARCSVGYRDARIVELARLFLTPASRGGIDAAWYEDPATPDDAIHEALLELPGIGPYAAANIMQLLGRYSRLPLDTESLRHGKNILGMKGNDRVIMKRLHKHYAPFGEHAFRSYWFELWTYYESKQGPAWTWVREKTAKAFTAAMLKEKPADANID